MEFGLFCIIAFAVMFCGIRTPLRCLWERPFPKSETTALKGIAALGVLIHHLGQNFELKGFASDLNWYLGGIAVGLFFFLSAFGLIRSYEEKGAAWLKKFVSCNVVKLYAVYVLSNLLYYLIFQFRNIPAEEAFLRILGMDFLYGFRRLNNYAWFISTILLFYLLFAALYALFGGKKHGKIASFGLFALTIVFFAVISFCNTGVPPLYARASLCFSLGVFYGTYERIINRVVRDYFLFFLAASVAMISFGMVWHKEDPVAFSVCVLIITLAQKLRIANPVIGKIGGYSLELYLMQLIPFCFLYPIKRFPWFYLFSVVTTALALAYLLRMMTALAEKGSGRMISAVAAHRKKSDRKALENG